MVHWHWPYQITYIEKTSTFFSKWKNAFTDLSCLMNGNKISKGIESLVGSIYYYHYVTDTVLSIGYNFCKSYEADFYDFLYTIIIKI